VLVLLVLVLGWWWWWVVGWVGERGKCGWGELGVVEVCVEVGGSVE
jgi:hypothetical protein